MTPLEASYAYCRAVARARAKNFYYSFVLLDADRKNGMCAVYAFMRYCDDLSDEPGATLASLRRWREALQHAWAGSPESGQLWPAFLDTVSRYQIPHEYFNHMIEGVESDIRPEVVDGTRPPRMMLTFEDLYQYCYRVASVVGLTTIHIFGFASDEVKSAALGLAEKCGIAFQLTNILRDVKEDAALGRVYLPEEDLERFRVTLNDLVSGSRTEGFGALMEFEIERARRYYRESQPLLTLVRPQARASLWALMAIYSSLLDRISESYYDVLRQRISLGATDKAWIVARAAAGWM